MIAGGVRRNGHTDYWGDYHSAAEAMAAGALVLSQDFDLMRKMLPVWVSHYLSLIDDGLIRIPEIDHVVSHYSSHSLREEVVKLLTAAGAMIDERKWFSNLASKGNTGAASIFILLEELYRSGATQVGRDKFFGHVARERTGVERIHDAGGGLMLDQVAADKPQAVMRGLLTLWGEFAASLDQVPIIDKLNRGKFR